MLKTVSINVTGKVQGVWYRKYTLDRAIELKITGFVKNLPDDTVNIVATGTAEQIQELVIWCWMGSPKSKVSNVVIEKRELMEFDGFLVEG